MLLSDADLWSVCVCVFQLTDVYLSVMVSVFIPVHLGNDSSLFPVLAPLLPWASLADIKALPPLQANADV